MGGKARRAWLAVAGSEDGRMGLKARECGRPLEVGMSTDRVSPLSLQKRMQALCPLLAQGEETEGRDFWGLLCLVSHYVLLSLIGFPGIQILFHIHLNQT